MNKTPLKIHGNVNYCCLLHCNGSYLMLDWNNAIILLMAVCWCLHLLFSVTNSLRRRRERERDLSHWAQLFPRNSNWIPAASQPNQWSLCARLSEFLSTLNTALSVPCHPGPTIVSLPCYGTLWTASAPWPLQQNLNGFPAHLCLQYG